MRFEVLFLGVLFAGCSAVEKDDDSSDNGGWGDTSGGGTTSGDGWGGGASGGSSGTTTGGSSTGSEGGSEGGSGGGSAEGSDEAGETGSGDTEGAGSGGDDGGGVEGRGGDTGPGVGDEPDFEDGFGDEPSEGSGSGDGTFNVDQLYVFWSAAYRDGELTSARYLDEDEGEVREVDPTFQFVWIDSDDYSSGSDDYLCSLSYDASGAYVDDFSGISGADDAYMHFSTDFGSIVPDVRGNCEGAASTFGVASMEDVVAAQPWGYGYGPMTADFEDELADALEDYGSLEDTPGVAYLRWRAGEDDRFTAWGYFQVIPFDDGDLLVTADGVEDLVAGVRDSSEPADGYYHQETVYVLTYSR